MVPFDWYIGIVSDSTLTDNEYWVFPVYGDSIGLGGWGVGVGGGGLGGWSGGWGVGGDEGLYALRNLKKTRGKLEIGEYGTDEHRTWGTWGWGIMTSSNGNLFRVTGPLCGEFTGYWWIPSTKASDAELWCFIWSENGKPFPRYWPFVRGIHRLLVNSPNKGQWRGALMFYLICAWTNDWANNRDAGDLRRHRGYYGVTVMGLKS